MQACVIKVAQKNDFKNAVLQIERKLKKSFKNRNEDLILLLICVNFE
jgi:hypothetical protein